MADFDLSSARPTYAQNPSSGGFDLASATANQQPQPNMLDSALDTLNRIGKGVFSAGPLETAAHLGSGAIAGLGGGLGFLSQLATNHGNVDDAKQFQQQVQNDFTYQPRTKAGQAMADAADKALGLIPQALNKAGEVTADVTGSPLLGAAVNTAGNAALNFLPLKGAYRALTGAERASTAAANAAAAQAAAAKAAAPRPVPTTPTELLQQSLDNGKAVGYQATPNYNPQAALLDKWGQGLAGKAQVEQRARIENQGVTNALASRSLGLDPSALLTTDPALNIPGNLSALRKAAVEKGYDPIRQLGGDIPADTQFLKANAAIKSAHANELSGNPDVTATADLLNRASFAPDVILDHISTLRNRASDAFSAGRADAGTALRKQAGELEGLLDRHLQDQDNLPAGMLTRYRAARQLIAKSHTVQDALNKSTGHVDATSIADAYQKADIPLTGDLRTIADFASAAPRITSIPNGAPLPTSPFNTFAGAATAHATGGLSVGAIPAARLFLAKWLLRHNETPALLQPVGKSFGQTALDAIHGNATAFAKMYGNAAPGSLLSTEGN